MDLITAAIDTIGKVFATIIILAHTLLGFVFPSLAYQPALPPTALAVSTTSAAAADFPQAVSQTPAAVTPKAAATAEAAAKPVSQKVVAANSAPAETPVQSAPQVPQEQLNTDTRAALVNILCTTAAGGAFKPISGSGVIIDSRGVVLTNAHVGQFFLLRDYLVPGNVECVIRTGSPATMRYTAKLLYLPPAWIDANASQLIASEATGTGENDYAFLLITGTASGSPLPATFPRLGLSTAVPDVGDPMLLAAYPAGFLSGELTQTSLYASSAFSYVSQLFAFDDAKKVDLFSIGGSIESQPGSSGGAVVRTDGTLAGIISTATLADSTAERDLRAITVDYIDRNLKAQGQSGIASLLTGDLAAKAATFDADIAPAESAKLEAVLSSAR